MFLAYEAILITEENMEVIEKQFKPSDWKKYRGPTAKYKRYKKTPHWIVFDFTYPDGTKPGPCWMPAHALESGFEKALYDDCIYWITRKR